LISATGLPGDIPIMFILGVLTFVFIKIYKTPKGRLAIDGLVLNHLYFGDVIRKVAIAGLPGPWAQ
jgi:type II secretory pathway component PulF